jgi:hypothetical protein
MALCAFFAVTRNRGGDEKKPADESMLEKSPA